MKHVRTSLVVLGIFLLFFWVVSAVNPTQAACNFSYTSSQTLAGSTDCSVDADSYEWVDMASTEGSSANTGTLTVEGNMTLASGVSGTTKLFAGKLILPWSNYFTPNASGTLQNNLISYWQLDETSAGPRGDYIKTSCGGTGCTLDDPSSGTLAVTGKIDNGGDFEAGNSDYLEAADDPDLSTGDIDFTIAAWVNLESKTAGTSPRVIISKGEGAGNREFMLYYTGDGADRWAFETYNSGGTIVCTTLADSLGAPALGTWYYIVGWHSASANTCNIQVNNGTVNSDAETGVPSDTTAKFRIGARYSGIAALFDGVIDEVGFWKKVLTSTERSNLYNGGSGNQYAPASSISIGSNAKIVLGPAWVTDADADGWPAGVGTVNIFEATAAGRRRLGLMKSNTPDCNDSNGNLTNNCYSYGQSTYYGYGQSTYYGYGQSSYYAYGQSAYYVYGQSSYYAYGQSTYYAYGQSSYYGYGQSAYAYVYGQSTYYGYGQGYYYGQASYYSYSQGGYYSYSQGSYYNYGQSAYGGYYSCFLPGTKILMANGSTKNIEDIRSGDVIYSYDLKNRKLVRDTVDELLTHPGTRGGYLVFNNTLNVTANHLMWVPSRNSWVHAGDMVLGDTLLSPIGTEFALTSIRAVEGTNTVYNLHLNGADHNYFAEGTLVHNWKN